ncbi:MAG TPA: ectonucleotide pyrophosphatase/phosphodiesterase [Puia sp.]|nr:ectonucleotide pyrophosphatase/phosphodiesterase [Puia sp.]
MYIWKKVNCLVIFFSLALMASAQIDSTQHITDGRRNSGEQAKKPYLILICGDGFRYDYAEKYHATNLLKLSAEGVRAESMIPSYPSVTHPNHFAIVSGLYPAHSGIVGNNFYDPALKKYFKQTESVWFGEEPIWVTAEKQHMLTASFFWIDASTPMQGMLPTYYYKVNEKKNVLIEDRLQTLRNWLNLPEDQRPHFLALYFPDTDHQGHTFGPDAPETGAAVRYIDSAVGQINEVAQASGLPVNFIFVSDHGMTKVDQDHPAVIPRAPADSQFVINYQTAVANLYVKDPSFIQPTYERLKAGEAAGGYDVYLSSDVPAELHYGAKDDKYKRVGDIIVIAKWPKTFNPKSSIGIHGFNPYLVKDVRASFYAWGPAFKQHLQIKPFQNVEVYDVMTKILGIQPRPNDGTGALAKEILK